MFHIAVITGTRAEYGLLRPLLRRLEGNAEVELALLVTGAHLARAHGRTVDEIRADGFAIAAEIPILDEANGPVPERGVLSAMARALEGFGDFFAAHRPDLAVVLGDRYEIFAAAAAAAQLHIPVAHISGGDVTEGAQDDYYRHCITKMASVHFPSTEAYRRRVIQLGERPESVFTAGSLGVENCLTLKKRPVPELLRELGLPQNKPYALCTFHPATREQGSAEAQVEGLLAALRKRRDLTFVLSGANADAGGAAINALWERAAREQDNLFLFSSLGVLNYLSLMAGARFVIGNSSSGIVEAPSFHIPTIDIGTRQKGRLASESVIHCGAGEGEISAAIELALSPDFRAAAQKAVNPYGDGGASERIERELLAALRRGIPAAKAFYDLPGEDSGR